MLSGFAQVTDDGRYLRPFLCGGVSGCSFYFGLNIMELQMLYIRSMYFTQ